MRLLHSVAWTVLGASISVHGGSLTKKHEAGRCAIRGTCGKESFFSPELPCLDNGLAKEPGEDARRQLVDLCGERWKTGAVCCEPAQIDALAENLKKANPIISSCPACKENFYNTFCTFTCSPDQSLFINVTETREKNGRTMVTELDQLISDEYGSGFYDSCKDVKFGPTNSNAMDFIGGGAKNYTAFLAFLGHKSLLGSPFQINFPRPKDYHEPDARPLDMRAKKCNDDDEKFRCSCVDCPAVCPTLPEVSETKRCHVGLLPCLSFAAILVYSVLILFLFTAVFGHIAWIKHSRRKTERLRLLQDIAQSDDEDEGEMVHHVGIYDRPQKRYWLNDVCDEAFRRLGYLAARYPGITIGTSIIVVGLLSIGWKDFAVERDPARLWISPSSAAAQEKKFFDDNFGPFYRAQQVFLVNDSATQEPSPVLSYGTLKWWLEQEERINNLKGKETGARLQDVCFKPTGDACVVQSVAAYVGNDIGNVDEDTWREQLRSCAESPVNCLPEFGQPINPDMIFGEYKDTGDVTQASAIIVSWVLNNHHEGSPKLARAMDWEQSLKDTLLEVQQEASERGLRLSFSTEISLEQELNKSTNTDAKIVVISYIIMFFYASFALGSATMSIRTWLTSPTTAMVQSKFSLGVAGIVVVLMSISASIGLFSAMGIKVTLIIAEVIPFIVLAVGVDNIFLIVHEFERVNISHPDDMVEDKIATALGRMGPSILLSASTETIAFALGAFVGMPAVRNFAIYAAGAVFINAVLQITLFVAVLALDQRRLEDHRMDCMPCIQVKGAGIQLADDHVNGFSRGFESNEESYLQVFIRRIYAPFLLDRRVKVGIVVIFLGIFTAGISLIPEISLGLDQRVAIPDDSYLIPYFNDLYAYFESGPPVYFVTKELNVTQRQHQRELCSRFTTCEQNSLTNILEQERKRPESSYLASTPASWIDDYLRWLDPELESCCVEDGRPCLEDRNPPWNITLSGMPEGEEFIHYLSKWISSPTDEDCPLGGKAPYSDALVIDPTALTIPASHFRSAHTPLGSQADFIEAYKSARRIANSITDSTGIEVFPYSIFYVFFDQYTTIVSLSTLLLSVTTLIILLLTTLLLGSLLTAAAVTAAVVMTLVSILGTMAVAGVSLNALSLVNLIISLGIAVEFCAHIARAFQFPSRSVLARAPSHLLHGGSNSGDTRDARVWAALVNVGGSVFAGITLTKLLGVCVLDFTRSKVFAIYYFRVWLALVLFGAAHALVLLPVLLSLVGGEGYVDRGSEGGLEEDLARRRYRALLPDDDSDSDY